MKYNLIVILGPTAVGKTGLAVNMACRFGGEIISADSRQVYRGMDIGTGKDLEEYSSGPCKVPYHLIDIAGPGEEFNLFRYNKLFFEAFADVVSRNKTPILAGGTGLYIDSALKGYNLPEVDFDPDKMNEMRRLELRELVDKLKELNPQLHNTTDTLDKERVIKAILIAEAEAKGSPVKENEIFPLIIGVRMEREKVKKNIEIRLKQRLEHGMIEEAETLLKQGVSHDKLEFFGLEYKYLSLYLKGELNYNDMFQKLRSAIWQFSKRQMTWFRKMEREGFTINWVEGPDIEKAAEIILREYFG